MTVDLKTCSELYIVTSSVVPLLYRMPNSRFTFLNSMLKGVVFTVKHFKSLVPSLYSVPEVLYSLHYTLESVYCLYLAWHSRSYSV